MVSTPTSSNKTVGEDGSSDDAADFEEVEAGAEPDDVDVGFEDTDARTAEYCDGVV